MVYTLIDIISYHIISINTNNAEYKRMKTAEQRLKAKHEIQAKIDKSNPDFDPTVKIEYNPDWIDDNKDSDDNDCNNDDDQNNNNNNDNSDRIHLSDDGIDKIKSLMLDMPTINNIPDWADQIPEDVWKNKLLDTLQTSSKNDDIDTNSKSEQKESDKESNTKTKCKNNNNNKSKTTKSRDKGKGKGKGKTKNKPRHKKKNNKNKSKTTKGKKKKGKKMMFIYLCLFVCVYYILH